MKKVEREENEFDSKGLKENLIFEMKNFGKTEQQIKSEVEGVVSSEEEWKLISNHRNIKIYQNINEDIFTFKGEMFFKNVDGKTIFDLICDTKLRLETEKRKKIIFYEIFNRKKWDPNYLKEEVLETISDKEDVIYIQIKTPKGISNRDNCLYRFKENIDNQQFFILSKSVDGKKEDENFVRAKTFYHCYYIETLPDNVTKLFVLSKQGKNEQKKKKYSFTSFCRYFHNFLIGLKFSRIW